MMALWSYLIDVQLMYVECFQLSWYPKKTFFADFSCILQICDYYHACFGRCLAETLLSKFYSHHCFGFSVCHHNLCLGGWKCFCQTTHLPLHIWFQGGIWTGYDCLSFIPLLPDGNQLIIHGYRFLDMEQTKFKFASCAVGKMFTVAY